MQAVHDVHTAFFPGKDEVTPDYWDYIRWRAGHRLFSSMAGIFATQVSQWPGCIVCVMHRH